MGDPGTKGIEGLIRAVQFPCVKGKYHSRLQINLCQVEFVEIELELFSFNVPKW